MKGKLWACKKADRVHLDSPPAAPIVHMPITGGDGCATAFGGRSVLNTSTQRGTMKTFASAGFRAHGKRLATTK